MARVPLAAAFAALVLTAALAPAAARETGDPTTGTETTCSVAYRSWMAGKYDGADQAATGPFDWDYHSAPPPEVPAYCMTPYGGNVDCNWYAVLKQENGGNPPPLVSGPEYGFCSRTDEKWNDRQNAMAAYLSFTALPGCQGQDLGTCLVQAFQMQIAHDPSGLGVTFRTAQPCVSLWGIKDQEDPTDAEHVINHLVADGLHHFAGLLPALLYDFYDTGAATGYDMSLCSNFDTKEVAYPDPGHATEFKATGTYGFFAGSPSDCTSCTREAPIHYNVEGRPEYDVQVEGTVTYCDAEVPQPSWYQAASAEDRHLAYTLDFTVTSRAMPISVYTTFGWTALGATAQPGDSLQVGLHYAIQCPSGAGQGHAAPAQPTAPPAQPTAPPAQPTAPPVAAALLQAGAAVANAQPTDFAPGPGSIAVTSALRTLEAGGASYRQLARDGTLARLGVPTTLARGTTVVLDLLSPRVARAMGYAPGGTVPAVGIPSGVALLRSTLVHGVGDAVACARKNAEAAPRDGRCIPVRAAGPRDVSNYNPTDSTGGVGASNPQPGDSGGVQSADGGSGQANRCELASTTDPVMDQLGQDDQKVMDIGSGAGIATDLRIFETAHAVYQLLPLDNPAGFVLQEARCVSGGATDAYQAYGYGPVNGTVQGNPGVPAAPPPDAAVQVCSLVAEQANSVASIVETAVAGDVAAGNGLLLQDGAQYWDVMAAHGLYVEYLLRHESVPGVLRFGCLTLMSALHKTDCEVVVQGLPG